MRVSENSINFIDRTKGQQVDVVFTANTCGSPFVGMKEFSEKFFTLTGRSTFSTHKFFRSKLLKSGGITMKLEVVLNKFI